MPSRGCAAQASSDSDRSNDWFAARLFFSFPARRDFFQSVGRAKLGNSPFAARRAPRT